MSSFPNAIADLLIAAQAEHVEPDTLQEAIRVVFQNIPEADVEELRDALEKVTDAIEDVPLPIAAGLSLTCGAIVERGGSPMIALPILLARLPDALEMAGEFVVACEEAAEEAGVAVASPYDMAEEMDDDSPHEHPADPVEEFGLEVAERLPEEAAVFRTLDPFCLGTIAMLSRSKDARKAAKTDERLLTAANQMAPYHARAAFLLDMLLVLDDEPLLVLHPEDRLGWKLRISGIGDNFQLHTLIAGTVMGDPAEGKLRGEGPEPLVLAAARDQPAHPEAPHATGFFNLVNWPGLLPDATLGDGTSDSGFWIWGEGVPADVLPFEGLRIVLLGPPPYTRGWNANRRFPGMVATMEIEETLDSDAVNEWLTRLLNAPKPTHPEDE